MVAFGKGNKEGEICKGKPIQKHLRNLKFFEAHASANAKIKAFVQS